MLSLNKENLTTTKYDISLLEEKIKMQKETIEENKKHNDEEINKKKTEIGNSQNQYNKLQEDNKLIQKHCDQITLKIGDRKQKLEKKSKGLFQVQGKIQTNINRHTKDIEFYENNHDCPTCKQSITEEWKQSQLDTKNTKIGEQKKNLEEVEDAIKDVTNELTEVSNLVNHVNGHTSEITKNMATMAAILDYISKLQADITELSKKVGNTEEDNVKLTELKAELANKEQSYQTLIVDKQYLEYASTLLKDGGIKTRIIKQYLPIMNKLINKYLSAMDFFVNFNIDENFNETIKSRFRDEFSYANFSEGEKMRIDRKSTRLNSSHSQQSRMPSSA